MGVVTSSHGASLAARHPARDHRLSGCRAHASADLAGALNALVRGCRAAAAVAGRRGVAVGGARERVHAAADAGRAGRAQVGGVDRAVADAGGPRRRAAVGGGARLGPARLPAPCAVAAPGGRRDRRAARRRGPADLDDLLALQGVGPYTARAIAAFAFGLRHPVVDTNTRRVIARAVARAGRARPAVDGPRPRGDGARSCPSRMPRRARSTPRPWSSARRCAPRAPRVRRVPDRRGVRLAPRRLSAVRWARARPCRRGSRDPTGRCAGS